MKKTIYMSLALCLLSITVFAQVNEKDIKGNWKLQAMKFSGLYYEIHTGKLELPETIDGMPYQASEEIKQSLAQQLKEQTQAFKDSYINLEKKQVKLSMGGMEMNGSYELAQKDKESLIAFHYTNGDTQEQKVYIKDNMLYMIQSNETGNDVTLILSKK